VTTVDGLLNFSIAAGRSRELRLVIDNGGTGGLTAVTLAAEPPAGWTVRFSPDFIAQVPPGGQVPVLATVTAADDAVAGDYVLGVEAEANEAADTVEFRATVKTSASWGLIGALVIAVALGGLALVFWRFGRR
jgi:uncharacterized membrane protein